MTTTSKMKTSPYTPINDMMTAEEAAEASNIVQQAADMGIPWQGLEPSEIQQICRTTGKR